VAGHDDLRRRAPLTVNRHHETAAVPVLAGSGLALMVPASGGDDDAPADAPAKQDQADTGRSHGEPGRARGGPRQGCPSSIRGAR